MSGLQGIKNGCSRHDKKQGHYPDGEKINMNSGDNVGLSIFYMPAVKIKKAIGMKEKKG
jgi:hypothetical protein